MPPASQWLLQLKYGNKPASARSLAKWLTSEIQRANCELPDLLVPVPSSPNRLKKRGYNQATLISRHIANRLQIDLDESLLIKPTDTGNQAKIGRLARQENLKSAFVCTRPVNQAITIGLVDDVITTGSTLAACRQALHKAGATRFIQLAICRTPE